MKFVIKKLPKNSVDLKKFYFSTKRCNFLIKYFSTFFITLGNIYLGKIGLATKSLEKSTLGSYILLLAFY